MLIVKGKIYRLQTEVVLPFAGGWVHPGFWWGPRCYKMMCCVLFLSSSCVLCTHMLPVSLDCLFLIVTSGFTSVYLNQ